MRFLGQFGQCRTMNVSRKWLEAFLRRPLDAREVANRLAMLGAPVDEIERVGADLGAFVVALVTEVRQHPDADKLRVTKVDDGSGTIFNVVCGAPNVVAGRKYPFARLGTVMPNGMTIERRKLRGEVSEGMLCSARELGIGEDHDGLLTLETDAAAGTLLTNVIDGGDERLVVDVTFPNRARDLLGQQGRRPRTGSVVRRAVPASGNCRRGLCLDLPTPARFGDEAPVGGNRLAIDDRDGCPRFLAAVIRGVKVGPSPEWLQRRLAAVGVRSINNVVDATNYVMLELNQPMHAYDAATLRGPAIIARASRAGERLTTLDGDDRAIPAGTLVIADADRAIGIAGVMGGRDTEVTDGTTDILLECASFNPARVRRARRALDLSTDASHRFERGTDRWGRRRCVSAVPSGADRDRRRWSAGRSGGRLLSGADAPAPHLPSSEPVGPQARVDLSWTEIEKQLVAIGATVVSKPDDGRIAVDVPGWRTDIIAEIDLIEEIARVHGYDRFPAEPGPFRPGHRQTMLVGARWTGRAPC